MAKIISSTKGMSRADWLQLRNKFIGGSDAGIVLGVNKYKTAFQLWLEKTEQAELEEIDNEAIHFGNVLEDVVAKEFERRTGKKVRKMNQMLQHDEHEFMMANLDRVIVGEKALLEVKTASAYLAKEWEGDEIPAAYLVQVNHYLAVTGYEKAYVCCLIGGQKFVWKEIARDEELINMIIEAEKHFWEFNVLGNNAPALDGSSAAEKYIKERFAWGEKGKAVDLKAEHKTNIEKYLEIKRIIDEYKTEQTRLENLIKFDLADAEIGNVEGFKVTWKNVTSNRFDSKSFEQDNPELYKQYLKAGSSRRFSIKGEK